MSTGKLYGDIEVKSISIKEGAIFQGKSSMIYKKDETAFGGVTDDTMPHSKRISIT
jgi:cytoskeletal protein CcmA (bactofilin family)